VINGYSGGPLLDLVQAGASWWQGQGGSRDLGAGGVASFRWASLRPVKARQSQRDECMTGNKNE